MQVDGQVPVDLSRIIVTVSIVQPWPDKKRMKLWAMNHELSEGNGEQCHKRRIL